MPTELVILDRAKMVKGHRTGLCRACEALGGLLRDSYEMIERKQYGQAAALMAYHAEIEDAVGQMARAWQEMLAELA